MVVVVTGEAEAAGLMAAVVVADFMEAGEEAADFTAEVAAVAGLIIPVADRMDVPEDPVVRVEYRDTAAGRMDDPEHMVVRVEYRDTVADRMDDPEVMVLRAGFRDTAEGPPARAEQEREQLPRRAIALAVRRRAAGE